MKKAIIVTVYNSENCGSFFQAYALMKTLNKFGYLVSFLKRGTKGSSHELPRVLKNVIRNFIRLNFSAAFQILSQWINFDNAQKQFNLCTINDCFYKETDLVVLGSDTIWNFDSKYFSNHANRYLGTIFQNKKIISYAASVGNTPLSVFSSIVRKNGSLSNLSKVLVRDSYTKSIVESVSSQNVDVVCDPTFLLSLSEYSSFIVKYPYEKKCLVLYCFEDLCKDLQDSIISYARVKDLIVVSLIKKFKWVDFNPVTCPVNLITYFSNADFVVTDTFHGTAFSLNFEIPFAVINRDKIKVKDLLFKCKALNRLVVSSTDFYEVVNNNDLSECSNQVKILKEYSLKVLKNHIE